MCSHGAKIHISGDIRGKIVEIEVDFEPVHSARPKIKKRAGRIDKIHRLEKELAEYKKSDLRERALGKSLPIPTKSMLAKLTGLDPGTVSRCFKDPAGEVLQRVFNKLREEW